MEETRVTEQTTFEVGEEPVVTEEKKTRKPREKARKPEELLEVRTGSMSDKEKCALIKYLKEELCVKEQQLAAYEQNIETTRKQLQEAQMLVEKCESFYRNKLTYVNTQLSAFVDTIKAGIGGGIN